MTTLTEVSKALAKLEENNEAVMTREAWHYLQPILKGLKVSYEVSEISCDDENYFIEILA
jgi:hypothetical protein